MAINKWIMSAQALDVVIMSSHVTYILTRHMFSPVVYVARQKKGETEKPLCITCVNTNQGSDSETSSPYLDALHRILRVGYLFHVSALDSFDTNPLQVDLAI